MYVLHHEGRLKGTAPCILGVTVLIICDSDVCAVAFDARAYYREYTLIR